MIIDQKTMEQETYKFLNTIFSLEEIDEVAIKDVVIQSLKDAENIKLGLAKCYHDRLSDVDINVWVRLHPIDFEKETPIYKTFFSRLGLQDHLFGVAFVERIEQLNNKEGMRICLNTGFRMDFTCFVKCDETAAPLVQIGSIEKVEDGASRSAVEIVKLEDSNRFWFVSIQALAKLLRQDYLIADHLSYMMLMDGLVVQMVERDVQYKTNFHRYGYKEALAYQSIDLSKYRRFIDDEDPTYQHIAENLCRAALAYDKLALKFNRNYQSHIDTFFEIWSCYLSKDGRN